MSQTDTAIPATSTDALHTEQSATLISAATTYAAPGRAAVLGCGGGAELPLAQLSARFEYVDYIDRDAAALGRISAKLTAVGADPARLALHCADLTGLHAPVGERASAIAAQASTPSACLDALGVLLHTTAPRFWRPAADQRYDCLICSGVLTQLQAAVRQLLSACFVAAFPAQRALLATYEPWKRQVWDFARQLEDRFVAHLETLAAPGAIIYMADTVQVCWLLPADPQTCRSTGAWLATRTARLADYLDPDRQILIEQHWPWVRQEQEGPYWGRLYGVQGLVYRAGG